MSSKEVLALIQKLETEGYARETVRKTMMLARQIFRYAIRKGFIADDPTDGIKVKTPKKQRRIRWITTEELNKVFEAGDELYPHLNHVFRFLYYTGLRKSEMMSLQWSDIDMETGVLSVNDSKTHSNDWRSIMKDTITMNYNDLATSFQVENIRLKMVRYASEHGISATGREFKASLKTVRKWVDRYDGTRKSLTDLSRRPKTSPNQIPKEVEERIVAYRKRYPTLGARRIKDELGLSCSHVAVHKALQRNGLVKKHRKKWRRKRDLRAIKEEMRTFEKIQVDVKYLNDIPEFYRDLIRHRLPRYQYTARDVRTGFTFVSYAREFSQTNSVNFMLKLAFSLNQMGIDPKTCLIQTDNGTEFVSGFRSSKRSICEAVVESIFAGHRTIPPGACTYQSDVESFHRRIEEEFYRTERINSPVDFYKKAATYVLWFNWMRYNRYKKGSPMDILCCSDGLPDFIPLTAIFPVLLDGITPYILKLGGYHVPLPDRYRLDFS